MDALFSGGRIIDAILVLVTLEALALILWRRRAGSLRPLLCNLASGAALMLAVRAALTGAHWTVLAGWLAAAGFAHVTELVLRLGSAAPGRSTPLPTRPDPHP